MSGILLLAWRYVAHHRLKTAILVACLTLTLVLPLTVHLFIAYYGKSLTARAEATPLVVGAKGNRFDLVLKALYFGTADVDTIRMSEVGSLRESKMALPIPLHLRYTARGFPIVGTTLEYFDLRGLRVRNGTLPLRLGQALLGAETAARLGLAPGDHLFSDQESLYDISKTYPLKMPVCGVLERTGGADDRAVFVDIKTSWIIEGITHGHDDVLRTADPAVILEQTGDNVVTNASIFEYNEVTTENIDSFHTHAEAGELPLSAVIVVPSDGKSATLLKARYRLSKTHTMLVPAEVVEELLGLAFRIKRFFDANFALVAVSNMLLIALVVLLSLRIRQRERETLHRIGCSRGTVFRLQACELGMVVAMSVVLAGALSAVVVWAAPRILHLA